MALRSLRCGEELPDIPGELELEHAAFVRMQEVAADRNAVSAR